VGDGDAALADGGSQKTAAESGAHRGDEGGGVGGFLRRFWRPLMLLVFIATAAILGRYFRVGDYLSQERIEQLVSELGWWGPLAFIGVFTVGQLISIPGIVFVAAAVTAWGKWPGIGASYVATMVSSSAGFLLGRLVGGNAVSEIRAKWVRKGVEKVEKRPFRSVAVLVAIFWMAPPLNYTLGMTRVPLWKFLVGTAIGLVPGLLATGFFFDWIVKTFL